jgi:uncharacterized membrane protein
MIVDILWHWIEAFIRWLHVIAGIAWIGSSFFFMHLDYSLKKRESLPDRAHGDAWQVHGGGFYHMVKYLVAPSKMPDELTWHKWESYATWMSGFALMIVVYYLGAELYLIDKRVLNLPVWAAVFTSILTLAIAWGAYDRACRSKFGQNDTQLAGVMFVVLLALAYGLTHVFAARGAFMQMGAIMGTIMAANVLMVIIPGQRKVIADLVAGKTPDPIHGQRGKQRSTHNNYLTLATVFVMIAGHYPLAFATKYSWLIIGVLIVMGALIRHFYNERHKGNPDPWWAWGVSVALGFVIVLLSMAGPSGPDAKPARRAEAVQPKQAAQPSQPGTTQQAALPVQPVAFKPVTFKQVDEIITSRCSMCHAKEPVWQTLESWQRPMGLPPKHVKLDTADEIRRHMREIKLQSVYSNAMPPGNITEMTADERAILAAWLDRDLR